MRIRLGLLWGMMPIALIAEEDPPFRLPDVALETPKFKVSAPSGLSFFAADRGTVSVLSCDRPFSAAKWFASNMPVTAPGVVDPKILCAPDSSTKYALIVVNPFSGTRVDHTGVVAAAGSPVEDSGR